MKIRMIICLSIIFTTSLFASSGDGLSFRFTKSSVYITWSDQIQINSIPDLQILDIIQKISSNYNAFDQTEKRIWINYYFDGGYYVLETYLHDGTEWEKTNESKYEIQNELSDSILNIITDNFDIKEIYSGSENIYTVFIPNEYINPDSIYKEEVNVFLQKSEIYLTHQSALQSNYQGYGLFRQ